MSRDRFEALVNEGREYCDESLGLHEQGLCSCHKIVTLLRREHAALVRAVTRLERHQAGIYGPFVALKDVLALLAKRKERTR